MSKLLSANFNRLKRAKIFWIVMIAELGLSIFSATEGGITAVRYQETDGSTGTFNACYFNLIPMIGIFFAVFISLFLGTEYGEGTIRNKIVLGHTRTNIYLSNYITCLAGAVLIYCAVLIGGLAAVPYLGTWQGGAGSLIVNIIIGLFLTASLTAILNMLSMLSTNKAVTAVVSIILALLLMIIASAVYNSLCEPEFTRDFVSLSADGEVVLGDIVPNPAYASGAQRKVYEFLLQFLPTGQGILIANEEVTQPFINIIYSAVITVIINLCGIFAFKKKDLK